MKEQIQTTEFISLARPNVRKQISRVSATFASLRVANESPSIDGSWSRWEMDERKSGAVMPSCIERVALSSLSSSDPFALSQSPSHDVIGAEQDCEHGGTKHALRYDDNDDDGWMDG